MNGFLDILRQKKFEAPAKKITVPFRVAFNQNAGVYECHETPFLMSIYGWCGAAMSPETH